MNDNMWEKIKNTLMYIWQLPQNLCGIIWKRVNGNNIIVEVENYVATLVGAKIYLMRSGGGVTLGKYVFISQTYKDQSAVILHDCGHVKHSKILGPLYLIVIGIPSILHAWLNGYIGCCKKSNEGYSHFFSEQWADRLAEEIC